MKKVTIFAALCGIIFAGITTTCNAAPNWGRFLPRPIVIPADSLGSDITIAAIDFRKYLPRPIVMPTDSTGFTAPIELVTSYQNEIVICKKAIVGPSVPPTPIDRKKLTNHQEEIVISAARIAKDPPPFPWLRKTLTA